MSDEKKIFTRFAPQYLAVGVSVIPTGGDDGKKPCERGYMQYAEHVAYQKTLDRWYAELGTANIGIMAGPVSNLTVVDIDDLALLDGCLTRFGPTPVIDQSPSGGFHLYYEHNGEKTLNRLDGAKIDVRAAGGVPLLIAPPSINLQTGVVYGFVKGCISDLSGLPAVNTGSLPLVADSVHHAPSITPAGKVLDGGRTDALYDQLRKIANECETIDELEFKAMGINEAMMEPPLTDAEVRKQVNGVWKLVQEGRCYSPGERFATVTSGDLQVLNEYPPALVLYLHLKRYHAPDHVFAVSTKGLATVLPQCASTIQKARTFLITHEFLGLVGLGESKQNAAGKLITTSDQYCFAPRRNI